MPVARPAHAVLAAFVIAVTVAVACGSDEAPEVTVAIATATNAATPAATAPPETPSPTPSPTSTAAPSPTATATAVPTATPSPTATSTPAPTPASTPSPTATATPAATATASPTAAPGETATPVATQLPPDCTPGGNAPPDSYYGVGLDEGDRVSVVNTRCGLTCDTVTAGSDGFWLIRVAGDAECAARDGDFMSFTLNGEVTGTLVRWLAGGAPDDVRNGISLR